MCGVVEGLMAASLLLSAGGLYMGEQSKKDAIRAQRQAEEEQAEYNKRVALAETVDKTRALSRKAEAVKEQAIQDDITAQKNRMKNVGSVLAQAGAQGTTGAALDTSVMGALQNAADVRTNIKLNTKNQMADINAQLLSTEANLRTNLSAPGTTVVGGGSGAATAFQFGASALSTGAKIYDRMNAADSGGEGG